MSLKILEHCCYRKYLNTWYSERTTEDSWQLIQYGDHTLIELLDWCINMAYIPTAATPVPDASPSGVTVTIALPVLTDTTLQYLAKNKFITHLNLITRDPIDEEKYSSLFTLHSSLTAVAVPDLHTQLATVSSPSTGEAGRGSSFVLQGNLLQSVCPGKYITTLGITDRYYQSIQPLLDSWLRLYSKKS